MAVTLRDVAAEVGVSPRTVSNVVNGFHHVSPAMRSRVQAALDDLGYRPNLMARGLRQGRTGLIGFLVPELSMAYFAELAHALVEHAQLLGLTVLVDETKGELAREVELLDLLARAGRVDGIVLSNLGLGGRTLTRLRPPLPVVLLGERTAGSALDDVGFDNHAASAALVTHLVEQGYRRIAVIAGARTAAFATSTLRLRGCRAALRSAGLPWLPELVVRTDHWDRAEGAAAMRTLLGLPDPPDAVVAFNDSLALGALRVLHEAGVAVPAQIGVVGFDDIKDGRYSVPTLTTIGPDKAEIARRCLEVLTGRIAGSVEPPRAVHVPFRLHTRESSHRPPAR